MHSGVYYYNTDHRSKKPRRKLAVIGLVCLLLVGGFIAYRVFAPTAVEKAVDQLQFDDSVTEAEKQTIRDAVKTQAKTYEGSVAVKVVTTTEQSQTPSVLSAYVPITNFYSSRQEITKTDLSQLTVYVPTNTDDKTKSAIAGALGLDPSKLTPLTTPLTDIPESAVAFVPATELTKDIKLLVLEGSYYLDTFQKGAVFRQAQYTGDSASQLNDLKLNSLASKDNTLKVNMTGVTAITRLMMRKLGTVKDPTYFSAKIGDFLADADITHVSNEVSFKPGCTYSDTVFCAPPSTIETLKDSGVDLVELTGNHNNDTGSQYNTDSINLYHSLGWHTFGGGLNTAEATKPYLADQKSSKVAFLGYNYPDSPNGGAIAGTDKAGANSFDFDKIKTDIETAKQSSSFVIVDVQFWECYAYPDGFVEYPVCDTPIPNQKEVFRKIADLGADMVIGSSAHQPQIYEVYNGKPIYYGLGNLYFEQIQWPGTERGIVLTHYFNGGKLIQTKLSLTVYDEDFQTHLMTTPEATKFLQRLNLARESAGL